ncbi:hypothetical protein KY317_04170 [Candidatus Woesearchaeota archaeon]|nr:hypothetical protein [Candidatus Woesearchaeota archaeon]
MNKIVEKNLEKMTVRGKGNMIDLLFGESYGGNAGTWQDYSCAGANFFYNPVTGEIMYFENIQHVPKDIVRNYSEHIFRLAVKFPKRRHSILNHLKHLIGMECEGFHIKYQIIDYSAPEDAAPAAQRNLEETVKVYNERHGFKL